MDPRPACGRGRRLKSQLPDQRWGAAPAGLQWLWRAVGGGATSSLARLVCNKVRLSHLAAQSAAQVLCGFVASFAFFLKQALDLFDGSESALATALGLSRPRVNRALRGVGGYTFGFDACVELAALCSVHPHVVLSAAGKTPTGERLNRLYNIDARDREEQAILADLKAIRKNSPKGYRQLRGVITDLAMNSRRKQTVAARRRRSK